eukprot:scaffold2425_cov76-Skeletonema_dohrnii-CCMP3373.AAC.6
MTFWANLAWTSIQQNILFNEVGPIRSCQTGQDETNFSAPAYDLSKECDRERNIVDPDRDFAAGEATDDLQGLFSAEHLLLQLQAPNVTRVFWRLPGSISISPNHLHHSTSILLASDWALLTQPWL